MLDLRGLIAILLGLAAFVWSGLALAILVGLFGAFALIHGLFSVLLAVGERRQSRRWWLLLTQGLVGIAVGIIAFLWPTITARALLYLVAVWAIVTGLFELGAALWLRSLFKDEWPLLLVGAVSLAMLWLFGAHAIIFGVLLLFAFRLRYLIEVRREV
jgi:uncharacterized membrane protein HdeD (DUF308 family)